MDDSKSQIIENFEKESERNYLHENLITYLKICPVIDKRSVDSLVKYMQRTIKFDDYKALMYVLSRLDDSPFLNYFKNKIINLGYSFKKSPFYNEQDDNTINLKIHPENRDESIVGKWSWVTCYDGYYLFSPPVTINGKKVSPLKIQCKYCLAKMQEYVFKYSNELPPFSWKTTKNNKIVLDDMKTFFHAILDLVYRKERKIIISSKHTLDWTDVRRGKNSYIFQPRYLISEVSPLEITKGKTPLLDESIMQRFSDRLPVIEYEISKNYRIVNFDMYAFRKAIDICLSTFQLEIAKGKGVNVDLLLNTTHTLDWKYVIETDGYYVFQPQKYGIIFKPIYIRRKSSQANINKIIQKYKDEIPAITYRINENLEITHFDTKLIDNFIDQCLNKDKEENRRKKLQETYERLRKKGVDMTVFTETFTLKWSEVRFYNRYFIFEPQLGNRIGKNKITPLRVDDYRCKPSFNYILTYFQDRLPGISYTITTEFKVELGSKPLFEAALSYLTKEQARIDAGVSVMSSAGRITAVTKRSFESALSKAATMKPEDFKKYKSKFIDFLVEQQMDEYKVVPVSENVSHSRSSYEEASFIFTAKSWDGRVFIIIENVNPDRSTLLFKVELDMYMTALHAIFDYIQSDVINKRSAIRDGEIDFGNIGILAYWTFNHDSYIDWMYRLKSYLA